jgi:DNA repair protein RadC
MDRDDGMDSFEPLARDLDGPSTPAVEPASVVEHPRERMQSRGVAALSDSELVAVMLCGGGERSRTVNGTALRLLRSVGGLSGMLGADISELAAVRGVGPVGAARLAAAAEAARRGRAAMLERGQALTSSALVHQHFAPLLADVRREIFVAVLLDMKNRVLRTVRISEGSLGASLVHPREAFRPAIREAAAAVIFVHNHPSGDPSPSGEDRRITERLYDAGALLGIPVLDHVIVGTESWYSFADTGSLRG